MRIIELAGGDGFGIEDRALMLGCCGIRTCWFASCFGRVWAGLGGLILSSWQGMHWRRNSDRKVAWSSPLFARES